jgi:hypothetical protein
MIVTPVPTAIAARQIRVIDHEKGDRLRRERHIRYKLKGPFQSERGRAAKAAANGLNFPDRDLLSKVASALAIVAARQFPMLLFLPASFDACSAGRS